VDGTQRLVLRIVEGERDFDNSAGSEAVQRPSYGIVTLSVWQRGPLQQPGGYRPERTFDLGGRYTSGGGGRQMDDPWTVAREILIVEDSFDDAELILHALRAGDVGDGVQIARDGQVALDLLLSPERKEQAPQLILLDLKLPKVLGLDVLRAIKSNPGTRHIPVVVFTSSREIQDISEAYQLGANSYIQKPVSYAELVSTLANLGRYWLQRNVAPPNA
jgi:CheY-like chemotaxis protein